MPLILSGNVASATADAGYTVANSCRFNDDDNPKMTVTPSSSGTNAGLKYTLSAWVKLGNIGADKTIWSCSSDTYIYITGAGIISCNFRRDGGTNYQYESTRRLRDPSAWYHIVMRVDTTDSTDADKVQVYVNNEEDTPSITSYQNMADDFETGGNVSGIEQRIGVYSDGSLDFDGYMAEVIMVDNQSLAPSSFGEFDSASPTIWKPKDVSGLTFGTNGFYLSYSDSADLGADSSGNSNDLTVTNLAAADQMTDTPTNNYSTWNPLSIATSGTPTFSQGNLQVITPVSGLGWSISTIGATSGKWYAEVFVVAYASLDRTAIGITGDPIGSLAGNSNIGTLTNSLDVGYWQNGYSAVGNSTDTDYGDVFVVDDLMGIALNIDDNEVIFYRNNTAQNSGTAISFTAGSTYHFCLNDGSNGGGNTTVTNFGQDGTFAGNKTAQGNADGNGYGDFYYSVPSGFYALCTKNLAKYG